MTVGQNCFREAPSLLTALFTERSGARTAEPAAAMTWVVKGFVAQAKRSSFRDLHSLLHARLIDPCIEMVDQLPCDGLLKPKGARYPDGFRMYLRAGQGVFRSRFTEAHEICHTFFYELVPEIKFTPHKTDPMEEWLCNIGASELLMPTDRLEKEASELPVSLATLEWLSHTFEVSIEAMALRLRRLGVWHCDFSVWHRMMNGTFVLDRKLGGTKADWRWADESIVQNAWEKPSRALSGFTVVDFERRDGATGAARIYYEIRRRGDRLIALWGRWKFPRRDRRPPLLKGLQNLR